MRSQYLVTVEESGTVTEKSFFSSREEAHKHKDDQVRRLTTKYAMMGK